MGSEELFETTFTQEKLTKEMFSSSDFASQNSDFNVQTGPIMFSASSTAYSPPPKPFSPPQLSSQFSPTYSSSTKPFVPANNIPRQNSGDSLWLPSNALAYPQQFNTQQHKQYHATNNNGNFQYALSAKRRARSNSSNLDPDSIMKIHDDLPSAAILAWERFKAKN